VLLKGNIKFPFDFAVFHKRDVIELHFVYFFLISKAAIWNNTCRTSWEVWKYWCL